MSSQALMFLGSESVFPILSSDFYCIINIPLPCAFCSSNLPAWYKSALFNELYFVSDGGTVWVDPINQDDISNKPETQLPKVIEEYGKFAYLEGKFLILFFLITM